MESESRHHCLIYNHSPEKKLTLIALILRQNLEEGFRCVYLNSPAMVIELCSSLMSAGVDVAREIKEGRLVLSSDQVTEGSVFNWQALLVEIEDKLDKALRDGYKGLFITGDMAWEFGATKDLSELLDYEFGLEKIFQRRPELRGICQYDKNTLPPDIMRKGLIAHSSLVVNHTLGRINPQYLCSDHVKQKAATDAELGQVIDHLCREH